MVCGLVWCASSAIAGGVNRWEHQLSPLPAFHAAHDHADEEEKTEDASAESRSPFPLVAGYCVVIVASSMLGGYLPRFVKLTHTRMQVLMSVVGGLMLGISVLHLLPHSIAFLGADRIDTAVWWMLLGMMTMFFLLRLFHFHQHGPVEQDEMGSALGGEKEDCGHDHDHDSGHSHSGHHHHGHSAHKLSWIGVAVGLSIHTLIDGVALGTAVRAEVDHSTLAGLGPFLAIVLHKPLDAVSIATLMQAGGWSRTAQNIVNLLFASMCPLGAILFLMGVRQFAMDETLVVGCSLAFAAGVFLCISLGDLLPEMEFHSHNRIKLSAALIAGVAIAWGIGFLEPEHSHGGGEENEQDHGHHEH